MVTQRLTSNASIGRLLRALAVLMYAGQSHQEWPVHLVSFLRQFEMVGAR